MKVILIDEIHGLGTRGDIVQVKDGYARNFLLPKNLARPATAGNIKAAEQEKKKWAALSAREKDAAQELASKFEGAHVTIAKRVGETGTLFGSVTSSDVAAALAAAIGVEVERRQIEMGHPIKSIGVHKIDVRLHRDVVVQVDVEVLPQAEGEA